jgi:hypothetical protein
MDTEEELYYHEVASAFPKAIKSNMFGVPCYKIGKKPFVSFYNNELVCKLYEEDNALAMTLKDASYFKPMPNAKSMVNWVQIPFSSKHQWPKFAEIAYEMVLMESKLDQ